ncbi:protein big brother-like [Dendronephthya gigantea]|uniref:protein big brother-like n=1 Tax=Dendronephthya gigantea TaxID=151771 RepID=UPI00106D8AB9|nr:protein big brother-like [Dendronephthya gigantea]
MPRVVENQLGKYNTDPLFKQLRAQSEIRYTGYCNCSQEERRIRFCTDCYEGNTKIGFLRNGVNLPLCFPKAPDSQYTTAEYVDFIREPGKVFLLAPLIFNGVCVKFYGWLDVEALRGFGCLEFDEKSAQIEDEFLRETLKRKYGSLEAASAIKAFDGLYFSPSEVPPRSSCIYDCRRVTNNRYSV